MDNSSFYLIIISIIVIICASFLFQHKQSKEEGLISTTINNKYFGGFDEFEGGKTFPLKFFYDRLELYLSKSPKIINMVDINKISIKSDIQIQNDVTLGRLLAVGVLAFGMKKKRTIVNNYLVINYNDNGTERNIILQTSNNENMVKDVNHIINALPERKVE